MKFWFCETCGKRLSDEDVASGAARDKQVKGIFCRNCAAGVNTIEFDAVSLKKLADEKKVVTVAPVQTRRPKSNTRLAAPAVEVQKSATAASSAPSMMWPAIAGVLAVMLVIVAVIAMKGDSGARETPKKAATPAASTASPLPPGPMSETKVVPPPGGIATPRPPDAKPGTNLLQNAGFEQVDSKTGAEFWKEIFFARDPDVARTGKASMRLKGATEVKIAPSVTQKVFLKKGIYRISGWIKAESLGETGKNDGVRLTLNLDTRWSKPTPIVSGTCDWKFVERRDIVAEEDVEATFKIDAYSHPTGTAWLDDLELVRQE